MNKVTSFEAACEIRGIDPNNLPDLGLINEEFRTTIIAQYKLMIIRDAIVGDWRPDYNNYGQRKWYPMVLDGQSRFPVRRFELLVLAYANAGAGSRLCFATEEQSDYCAQTFIELWCELLGGTLPLTA
jgi:hypothetical protein